MEGMSNSHGSVDLESNHEAARLSGDSFCSDKMEGMLNSDGSVDLESNHDQPARLSEDSFCRTNSDKMEGMSNLSYPELSPWNADFFGRSNSDASVFSEATDDTSSFASESPSPSHWIGKGMQSPLIRTRLGRHVFKKDVDDQELEEVLMKERFAYLMLGGDMSGGGKRHCPARAVSDAITNLYSSTLDSYDKLEPLELDHRANWRREMNFLLAPCDQIIEFVPAKQETPDGTPETMIKEPRPDIKFTLPLLKKFESYLLEIMDNFEGVDLGIKYAEPAPSSDGQKVGPPIPLLPRGGLSEKSRKLLKKKHRSASQIFQAARVLNNQILAEMDIPESYIETLPKTGKAVLGDVVYRYLISSAKFRAEELIGYLNITSEEEAKNIVEKLEEAMVIWRGKVLSKEEQPKSSWKVVVKDLVSDADKNTVLAKRAEETICRLKEKYPNLVQTSLEVSKLACNTDMGKAILESYSRVLENLASKIETMIDDILVSDQHMGLQIN